MNNEARPTAAEDLKRLQECLRFKALLVSYMSHEMRGPLNIVMGYSSILLEEMQGVLNAEQKESLRNIQGAGQHMLAMVDDLVAISRTGVPGIEGRIEDFHIAQLVCEVVDLYRPKAEEKGLSLTAEGDDDIIAVTDGEALRQCLMNLVDNAVKYTEAGTVAVRYSLSESCLVLEVRDTGIGISPEDCDQLFTTFVRLETPLKRRTPGTGLGLFLTAQLARNVLGGDISCTCVPGSGSTFTLKIPQNLQESGRRHENTACG